MKIATHEFEKLAKRYKLDTARGVYGELLNPETRRLWFFWFKGWKARIKVVRERARKVT